MNEKLGNTLDKESFEAGKTAVAIKLLSSLEGDYEIPGKTLRFSLPDGKEPSEECSIQIAAVADGRCSPAFFAGGISPEMIVSEKYAEQLMGDLFTELINVEYEDAFSEATEQEVKAVFEEEQQVSHDSKLESYSEMKNSEIQVKVLGNSIGFIIGMTAKQIRKMLRLEGVGYAVISIILSLIIGLPISYAVFDAMNLHRISFSIPWSSNLTLFGIVLVVCMIVPVLIYQKTQNISIIERLRNGEDQ